MPGFNLVGNKPIQPSNKIGPNQDIRRSHRWFIETLIDLEWQALGSDFKLYAKKITLPQLSFEEEVFRSLGAEYKFASLPKFQDVTIEFYDVVGVAEQLYNLQTKIWSPENGTQAASTYKGTTRFIVQTSTGGGDDIRYTLYNSWIKSMSHSELTYERNELKSITLTLSYDYYDAETKPNSCGPGQGGPVTTPSGRIPRRQSRTNNNTNQNTN